MGNKKRSKQKRRERRLAEIARAHSSVQGHTADVLQNVPREDGVKISVPKSGFHELPMKEIKKDMVKNAAYLVFAIGLIVVIEISGLYYKLF